MRPFTTGPVWCSRFAAIPTSGGASLISSRWGTRASAASSYALASLPGRYVSTEVAGGFTGRIIGMYAVGGDAAFDWLEYQPVDPAS